MRQLFPEVVDVVDPADVYADRPPAAGRPAVRLNMISSVDGATTLEGVSGGLGSLGDKRVFAVLRSLADVVLVAAGTVRAEHYGPSTVPVAVVTRTAQLDWQSPFFTEAKARPIVLTGDDAPEENLEHASAVADVVLAGTGGVDLRRAAGVLDELCLTVSPMLAAGDAKRILAGPALATPTELSLASVLEDEGYLFLRYRVG